MLMRIIGINGSGRAGGNTAVLVQAVLEGAAQTGADAELMELGPLAIAGCDGCRQCKETQRCVKTDDMQRFYDTASATDVLVLASPVYMDGLTAQLMAFLQRTYCYLGPHIENRWPRKDVRAVVGVTYGAPEPGRYDHLLDWLAGRLNKYFDITTVARLSVPGARFRPLIDRNHPEIQRAFEVGRTLVGAERGGRS